MNDFYERLIRQACKFMETDVDTERQEPQSELHEKITRMLLWANLRLVPLLLIMLAIDLPIIFGVPGGIVSYKWADNVLTNETVSSISGNDIIDSVFNNGLKNSINGFLSVCEGNMYYTYSRLLRAAALQRA